MRQKSKKKKNNYKINLDLLKKGLLLTRIIFKFTSSNKSTHAFPKVTNHAFLPSPIR